MDIVKTQTVERNDKEYEVRVWREEDWYLVRVFESGRPIGLTYGVQSETRKDFALFHGMDAIEELKSIALSHLEIDDENE